MIAGGRCARTEVESKTIAHITSKTSLFICPRKKRLHSTRMMHNQIECKKNEEDDRDDAVHGKKRGVKLAQIILGNQRMFIGNQQQNRQDAGHCYWAQAEYPNQSDQKKQHRQMEAARDPQGIPNAAITR